MKDNSNLVSGVVVEAHAGSRFSVDANGKVFNCVLSGKIRLNKIKIIIGDKVGITTYPGSKTARIEKRY